MEEKTTDNEVQLVKYTGNYTSTDASIKSGDVTIEIPGMLKVEQIVLANGDGSVSDK